jgi:N-(5-amino-5-carboxypentanoyl)-L-cysteinyl-D-valine synthase
MLEMRPVASAGEWQRLIEDAAGDRCDLDILLKDEWRHKITVRDDPPAATPVKEQSLVIRGRVYSALREFLLNNGPGSLGAVVLTAIHSVLGAYGHGSRTVVAYVDAAAEGSMRFGRVLPTIIDNFQQSELTRVEAVEIFESALRQTDAWMEPAELFHRGLFDAVLVLAAQDGLPAEIPLSPLVFVIRNDEREERLRCTAAYAESLFEDSVIMGVLEVVQEVLDQIVSQPARLVRDLELISEEQGRQLEAWNATDGDFPRDKRLHQLFEDAAQRTPELEAVVCGNTRLAYRELNELCNRFSRRLAGSANVRQGGIVALYLDKCHLIVVATLSIWKAGAAYVPIDPGHPAERVLHTLGDTQATHIITNRRHSARLRELLSSTHPSVQVLEIEVLEIETELEAKALLDLPAANPQLPAGSDEIAYVTYTSGTTGVPKGVAKIHSNVVNSITDLSERYDMRRAGEERVALLAAFVFEPFMRQTLIALINSQTLVVVPDDFRTDPHRFSAFVARHGITYLNGTGSILQHFDLRGCGSLKKMLLVGEELTSSRLRLLRENFGGEIINEYSFTETAFVTTIKVFAPGIVERADRSIGRPLRNVKCYVLAQNLKQVPIGAIGELYIGGRGIARGYLNRDSLTAERFLPNPFQTEQDKLRGHNAFIYKTGDLARMLPNGEIEFMGRSDFQLKLNGVRVEPGEIEARVTEYPGVRQCVVVPYDGPGGWRLVGYFVADAACEVSEAELLAFLEERLIRVMVPARMVRLEAMPVNVNGKIDRRALPQVDFHGSSAIHETADAEFAASAAQDGIPDVLREIWGTVLGVPVAGVRGRDDFFRFGGQSIACIQLLMRIWQRMRLVVTVEDMFRLKTLANLAGYLAQQPEEAPRDESPAGLDEAIAAHPVRLLANGLQQGLMYHALKSSSEDDAYVMQSVYRYHRPIHPELLKQAWVYAQRKYPSLRLRFEWEADATQIIEPDGRPLNWQFVDLGDVADAEVQEARIRSLQERERMQPYVLAAGGLFRLVLIRQRDDLFSLILSYHHIILDGWSLPVLLDNVHRMYLLLTQINAFDPAVDTAYVAAQRYSEAHRGDHVEYWMGQIERITERGDFGGLLNQNSRYKISLSSYDQVMEHRTKRLSIDARRIAAIKAECARYQLTLHSVLQFVWHTMLYSIGGSPVTVVGTVVSGRNLPIDGVEESVGLFINTLPLIVDHGAQASKTVAAAIAEIQDAVNRMNSRSIVELGRLQSGEAKRRLFDTLLVLENYPRLLSDEESRQHEELFRFERLYDSDKVDYPVAVVAREEDGELTINLWYAGELFDHAAIETISDTVQTLFTQVAENFSQPVRNLEYISAAVQARYAEWNKTDVPFPQDQTLDGVFNAVAAQWPEVVAVVYERTRLTYRELNRRANQLAHYLRATVDLRPNDLVALVVDKSEWMFISILAVWKAGAAYVPIDPGYPDDRVAFMLEDTRSKLVIVDEAQSERLRRLSGEAARPVLSVQRLPLDDQPQHAPVTDASATDLAYAIYTSGTTGKPKAVLVEHRGVVNLHASLAKTFALRRGNADEAILSFSNYIFDHFIEQMTDALLSGQTLVVLNDEMRTDKARLYQYMNDNHVTYLSGTPSVLSLYEYSTVPSLTRIDAIGEDFTTPVFNKIRETFAGMIINGYGPTEISITSHKRPYGPDEPRLNKSIGFPVDNTKCYILNSLMKLVPVGGIGELYIGGVGVARGYLNRDELTAERFVRNPFQTEEEKKLGANARMYKTGDLVRWLPNGELEYLGRNDLQVKIRGQRVELGEIEEVLASYPGVSRALVIAREHGAAENAAARQKYLVGFYLSDCEIAEQDILQWIRTKIPAAIVPVRILRIGELPVTSSGKLDVGRLPKTDFVPGDGAEYVAPSSDLEIELCRIWSNVLGTAPELLGVRDDFFSLGGDSLRAIKLAQSVTDDVGRVLGVGAVFSYRTIESQARHIQQNAAARELEAGAADGLANAHAGDLPVSLAQERLLFIDDFVGYTFAYNIPFVVEMAVSATVSRDAITGALRTLVRRHPALRTLLRGERDGVRLQHVLNPQEALAGFEIMEVKAGSRSELDAMLVRESEHVFRLDEELPIRVRLFELAGAGGTVYVSIVVHHSAFDGWSWNVFRRELEALARGVPEAELPALRASYSDFTLWQRRRLTGDRLSALTAFWMKTLAGFEPLNLLPDKPRPPQFDYQGREVLFDLDAATTRQLKDLARTARVSFYSVLFGAYCLMLKTWTGQRDIIAGTPSANRGRPEFEGVIGFFTNLLVLRVRIDSASTLLNYLRSVGETGIQAQVHQELPFEQLVKSLQVTKDPSRHPVVQTVFSLLNDDVSGSATGLEMKPYVPDNDGWTTAKFDLSVTLTENATGLAGNFTYAASLFHPASVNHFVSSFKHILMEFARLRSSAGTARVSDVACVDNGVLAELLAAGRGASARSPYSESRTLHGVFEEMAERWPAEVAVAYGTTLLSYRELNERANQLAHHLRAIVDLRPNDLVALMMDKSEWMIVVILAVWKAGAAYVPIDPGHPDDRVAFMLEDTQARLAIADEAYSGRLRKLSGAAARPVLSVARLSLDEWPRSNPVSPASGGNLAYAIYTSGTTGKPKAVLVQHRGVVNFRNDLQARYFGDAGPRQAVLLLANYVFDFSIEQLALSILSGHKLIVPATAQLIDDEFYDDLNRHGLTFISGTPTQMQQFDLSRLKHLKLVLVAGEAFQAHHFDKIRREFSGLLMNAYGTTETTVYNTVKFFKPGAPYQNAIGEPLLNTQLFVLGNELQLLPIGAVGELCIAGDCVSAGYLNQPELTRERFVPNPFQTETERSEGRCAVLYKTGDVVRRRLDGELEFLGRNDSQVKIHGLRIELREVEAVLASCPGVRQCAVVVRQDRRSPGNSYLAGYYVAETPATGEEAVAAFLRAKLTQGMVPAQLVRLEGSLPVTINGKLDTDALPVVDFSAERAEYAAPRSRLEARLCQMWSRLLPGTAIGVNDDFFLCGGDSISALQLAGQVRREFKLKVSVKQIFDFPTVRAFVKNVLGLPADELRREPRESLTGPCPLLPIQEWFFAKPLESRNFWNQYFGIHTPPLEFNQLCKALDRLVDHHDAFALRFRSPSQDGAGEVEQFYSDAQPKVVLHTLDVKGLRPAEITAQLQTWQSGFHLERGPLACAAYLHGFEDGSARVWLALHHLIVDVVSWRIIAQDLEILYNGGDLGPRGASYREWTQAVRNYPPSEGEAQFWAEVADGVAAEARTTTLRAVSEASHREQFTLSEQATQTLLSESNRAYNTHIVDLLLTALGGALSTLTQSAVNYVSVEGHGRESFAEAPEAGNTVGWFTTMHPVAVEAAEDIGRSIVLTMANRGRAPHHGIGYGALRGRYGSSQAPLPPVSFNFLGQFAGEAQVHGQLAPGHPAQWALDMSMCGSIKAAVDELANDSVVDVTMHVSGSRLVAQVDSRMSGMDTQRFTTAFRERLEEIIAHTSAVASGRNGHANGASARPLIDANDFDPYILVNEGASGDILFLLPPGEGGAESYLNNIARHLPGIRLVLFNNIHLRQPMRSFEALAQYYLPHVRRLQPSGPYNFLGWSFGGVLSLEMSLELARMGETISNLVLIDPLFNVRKAGADIGQPDVDKIFDPINYRYVPSEADLEQLRASVENVLLFKAAKPSNEPHGEEERRFFEYYAQSPSNNLETLLPSSAFTVELLKDNTHFSWVRDERMVAAVGSRTYALMRNSRKSMGRAAQLSAKLDFPVAEKQ